MPETPQVGFVCVQNAGRSQMSAAFAEEQLAVADATDALAVVTGGTHPADAVHPEVVTVMAEVGIDIGDRTPQRIDTATLNECAVVVTMGCSTLELDADVEVRDWALEDPHGQDLQTVRAIRDAIRERVAALLDELLVDLRA